MGYLAPTDRFPGEGANAPAVMTDERATLQGFLQRQRELIVWKVSGLPAEVLQAEATPTGLTPLGVVRHLVLVERTWFRDRVAGEPGLALPQSDQEWADWPRLQPEATTEAVVAEYAAECERADAAIAAIPLDAGDENGTLRWVYLHMIEETARHLGQIDLLRERADGMTGEDPYP